MIYIHNKKWISDNHMYCYSSEKVEELRNILDKIKSSPKKLSTLLFERESFNKDPSKTNYSNVLKLKGIGFHSILPPTNIYDTSKGEEWNFMIDPYITNSQELIPLNPSQNKSSNEMLMALNGLEIIQRYYNKRKGFLGLGKIVPKERFEEILVKLGDGEVNLPLMHFLLPDQFVYTLYEEDFNRIKSFL